MYRSNNKTVPLFYEQAARATTGTLAGFVANAITPTEAFTETDDKNNKVKHALRCYSSRLYCYRTTRVFLDYSSVKSRGMMRTF